MAEPPIKGIVIGSLGTVGGAWLLQALGFLGPIWAWIASAIAAVWAHLGAYSLLPNWLIYFLVTVVLFVVFFVAGFLLVNRKGNYNRYKKDVFFNAEWRWKYVNGVPDNLWSVCPACKTQLVYSTDMSFGHFVGMSSGRGDVDTTTHFCETCQSKGGPFPGSHAELVSRVKRQIHRKLETEQWRKVVEEQ